MADEVGILVVDDDPDIRDMLNEYLSKQGYRVLEAEDGESMRELLVNQLPNVVLLDINLPGEDGLSLARYLRERYQLGIIMITGAGDVVDRIVGLEVGADDYVSKPFDLRELLARIKSVLRRITPSPSTTTATPSKDKPSGDKVLFGRCILDLETRRLVDGEGKEIAITSMEFDMLQAFASRPNRVLSRDQILTLTQGREWDPYDRSVDIRITRIRRKIEPDPSTPQIIKTVRGGGYMFVRPSD